MPRTDNLVWYVAYGSNMHADRLACYLAGGTPPGALAACPGARDPHTPRRDAGVWLPGGVYFATRSPVWDGGRAFYDPEGPGPAAARAWLITAAQLSDIVAQEMYRGPGTDLDLTEVLTTGRDQLGPGRYETLLHVGAREGYPLLTFTAPWRGADVTAVAPSLPYLRILAGGLAVAHHWDAPSCATYLAGLRGAAGTWTPETLASLLDPPGSAARCDQDRQPAPGSDQ